MERRLENLIIATQRLAAMGLHPTYARFELIRCLERLETEDPEDLAASIFEYAEEEWKSPELAGAAGRTT